MHSIEKSPLRLQIIILLASLSALSAAAVDMYLPAFPAVAIGLDISPGQVQQTLTVYLVGLGIGQGLYGPLLDRFGRKPPLLAGLSLFVLGSLAAALSSDFQSLLLARFLQAIGAAAGVVAARAIVTDTCDTQTSARVYSLLTQMMMIAPITAPTIGSLVLLYGDWPLIFWILFLLSAVCFLYTLQHLPETLDIEKRIPLSVFNIVRSYFKQLCKPRFLLYTLASGFTFGCLFIYVTASPFIFIDFFHLSPSQFGYVFAINAAAMIVVGQVNIYFLRYFSAAHLLFSGLVFFIAVGVLLFALVYFEWVQLWIYWLLLGLALSMLGLITGNITAVTMENTQHHAGVSSALMGSIQFLLAAVIGFFASLIPPALGTLPVAILSLGLIAIGLCMLAQRYPSHYPE